MDADDANTARDAAAFVRKVRDEARRQGINLPRYGGA
jgi:hypothetical protein